MKEYPQENNFRKLIFHGDKYKKNVRFVDGFNINFMKSNEMLASVL